MYAGGHFHAFELCELVSLRNADISFLFPFCLSLISVFLLNAASFAERLCFLAMHRLSAECGRLC